MSLNGYYDRYNGEKKYVKSLFLAGKGLQSAELNEIQDYANTAIQGIGDALFADGDVIKGCTCVIDNLTGETSIEAGKIYLKGLVRDIHAGSLTIPVDGSVYIGVIFEERTITELEDPLLRDPAVGTRNYQEAGASRLQYSLQWAYKSAADTSTASTNFYTIYNVENGVLVQKALAPQMDSVSTALARYDHESNGSYVVKGMNVTCLSAVENQQTYTINEGKAHVNGYEVSLKHSLRKVFDDDYDLQTVNSDPYIFDPDAHGKMKINLNYQPLHEIKSIDITAQKTTNLTHGSYSGALDPIPATSVESIVQIKQGGTIYQKDTDYKLTAGQVDWSPSGDEPAPGSTYEITYKHRTQIEAEEITDSGFTISGAVTGSTVLISYTWKMPRFDLITIDSEGIIRRVKGLSHAWSPTRPTPPDGQLILAEIYQTWRATKPKVTNNAIKAVNMADIESMRNTISDLYYLISQLQLKNDANASDPTAKKGVFVDPFFDDDMRDQGSEQTGAIINNKLMLPIDPTITDYAKDQDIYILPYELEPVISQEMQTGTMKVNPYNAFDPIPADLKITLNIDHWTDIETQWLSPITEAYSRYTWGWWQETSSREEVKSTKKNAEYMRQIQQAFTIDGLKPGETVSKITFNGLEIPVEENE